MNRFSRSWELIKASARVLAADKELLVFPIISAIASTNFFSLAIAFLLFYLNIL